MYLIPYLRVQGEYLIEGEYVDSEETFKASEMDITSS